MNVIDYDRSLSRLSTQIIVPGQWQASTYFSFDHIFSFNLIIYRLILTLSCCRIHHLSISMYLSNATCFINYRKIFESLMFNKFDRIDGIICKLIIYWWDYFTIWMVIDLQTINTFGKFRAKKLFYENLRRDDNGAGSMYLRIFAGLAIGRPLIVRVPGTRVSRYRSQRSFRHGPSKLKFRRRKGLETGQPEVVDVQRRIPTQVIIVL